MMGVWFRVGTVERNDRLMSWAQTTHRTNWRLTERQQKSLGQSTRYEEERKLFSAFGTFKVIDNDNYMTNKQCGRINIGLYRKNKLKLMK